MVYRGREEGNATASTHPCLIRQAPKGTCCRNGCQSLRSRPKAPISHTCETPHLPSVQKDIWVCSHHSQIGAPGFLTSPSALLVGSLDFVTHSTYGFALSPWTKSGTDNRSCQRARTTYSNGVQGVQNAPKPAYRTPCQKPAPCAPDSSVITPLSRKSQPSNKRTKRKNAPRPEGRGE